MPDGIYELSGTQAKKLEFSKRKLIDNYLNKSYELVSPPLINFASHNSSFKFSDSVSNKTLEIVADTTRQIAIIDAKKNHSGINKYCYINQIIKPYADDFYSSRAPIQVGAEIYGDASLEADIEIIQTMVYSLNLLGIKDINITISNLSVLTQAFEYLNLQDNAKQITEIFKRRSAPDLTDFINTHKLLFCTNELLSLMSGNLVSIRNYFQQATLVIEQINQVTDFSEQLSNVNTVIDLGDINAYNYHNGLIFSAYHTDFSKAIARGGRYNNFLNDNRAATGFSFDLKFIHSKLNT